MDKEREMVDKLILENALEVSGVDSETGELLYTFTPKIKDIYPELYAEHMNHVNSEIMKLWERGYVDIDFFIKDPSVSLTEKALDEAEYGKLSKDEQWAIEELKRIAKTPEV
jgi:hypothetical protein